jgi:retinoblastoma-like protein 1
MFSVDKDEVRSPKRACTERRNVLVDISFRSPVKDTIKSKLLPPLQSAFARFTLLPDSCVNLSG